MSKSCEVIDLATYRASLDIPTDTGPIPPTHRSPTEAFMRAVETPRYFENDHLRLAAYTFRPPNDEEREPRPPLVTFMQPNRGTASPSGIRQLSAMSTHIGSTIIRIDMPGTGKSRKPNLLNCLSTGPDAVARATDHILELMGFDGEVDVLGVCIGGAMAASLAKRRAERARHLITYVACGFSGGFLGSLENRAHNRSQAAKACNASDDEIRRQTGAHRSSKTSMQRLWANTYVAGIGQGVVFRKPMEELADKLHPATKWYDFAGSLDVCSDWKRHYGVVTKRDTRYPDSSHLTIINDAGHDWPVIDMPRTAREVELTLRKADQGS